MFCPFNVGNNLGTGEILVAKGRVIRWQVQFEVGKRLQLQRARNAAGCQHVAAKLVVGA